jgi:capsular polysaccharide biosynthesis protein
MSDEKFTPWLPLPSDFTKMVYSKDGMFVKRRIVSAATRIEGHVLISIRHWDRPMRELAVKLGVDTRSTNNDQGFVDQYGNYLSRSEAYQIVIINEQQLNGNLEMEGYTELYSEHLY